MAAMAAIPPPAPGPSPSPSTPLPHPGPPFLASSSPPSSIPPLQSSSPKAGNGQPRARPATAPNKLGLDGGEPPPGTDGVGRVGGQEIDGGEPERGTDGSDDPRMRTDIGGGKRPQCKNSERNQRKMPTISKEKCQKVVKANEQMEKQLPGHRSRNIKSASPGLRSPIQVTSSPGVNFLVRSTAVKRANMAGSPKTPQPPSCSQIGSPSLQDLSPDTRATNSHASKRKPRKLISDIWREAEPIYKEGKLVEGKCIHCHQIFAASRDTGTSHMKRHLKVCEAKTAMNDMVTKMGHPDGIDPNWKFNPKLARRKLLKLIVINEMPFSLVEYTPFREFTASLNPWFENISRTTIKNDCVDAFKHHGDAMKESGTTIVDQIDLLQEQVKMLGGEVALSTSSLKRLLEQAANNPDDSQIHTFSKLSMQLSEKSFELEIMYAEVQITKSFKTSYKQRYRKMQNSKKQLRN
ncbi:hypothetical protein ACQ4PT_026738 [Festuca glaucescens]